MFDAVRTRAAELGFDAYSLAPRPIPYTPGPVSAGLFADPSEACPGSTAILLLVYPYLLFEMDQPIPAYYLASHSAYMAAKELSSFIRSLGLQVQAPRLPLRALALHHGIGCVGKNGLLRITPYGSAFVLQALAVEGILPQPFDAPPCPPCPNGCTACMDACPSGAISHDGLDVAECMRLYMDTPCHPEWIMARQRHYIGCECCLRSCPFNLERGIALPSPGVLQAFDSAALIRGNAAPARNLVGKNMTGGGKLTAEAITFTAERGLCREEITLALCSPFEAVRRAAAAALRAMDKI